MTVFEGPPLDSVEGIGPLTLGGVLLDASSRFADNEALVFDDPLLHGKTVSWTYAELEEEAWAVAAGLVALGVGFGERVGILMGNRPEFVSSLFGIALAGGVAVPLSTFSTQPELAALLADSAVGVLLTQTRLRGRHIVDDVDAVTDGLPYLRNVVVLGDSSWDEMLANGEDVTPETLVARHELVQPHDHGLILFSSGTTSRPKGVLHLHRAPSLQAWLQADIFRRTPQTRLWAPLPLFWTAGLTTALLPTIATGGCVVLQETFDAGEGIALIAREQVTEPYTLPHQTTAMEEHPDWAGADLSSLVCVYGKSGFARHPSVQGDTTWNMPVAYGMSETCACFVSHRWDSSREDLKASTGRVLPGGRLRVVDPETGESLGPDQDGELALAGPTVLDRYVGSSREATFDSEGFLRTGDVGYVDGAGFVHWTGRRTEMIKTAGANVSPAELEVALRACAGLKRARVVGVPDARLGQAVVLCAVPKEGQQLTAEALREFLAARVASYKLPRHTLFFADGELPTTASDTKVRDDELVALVQARLQGESS